MWNIKLKAQQLRIAAALAIPFGAAAVIACGPDFPLQMLDDRAGTLKATPANSFAYEASHLVKAGDNTPAPSGNLNTADKLDAGFMTPAQLAQLKAVRALKDGDAAYAQGADLPPAVRLYAAGAVAYLAGAANAQKRFQAVLDLPAADGDRRAVAAAYMLGQSHAGAMPGAGNKLAEERAQAGRAYALARARAAAGAPDPDGLAAASYGEQARLFLFNGAVACSYPDFVNTSPCADKVAAADLQQAIHLYAEQAARNADSGVQSLRAMAAWALSDPERAQKLIADPIAQRLLVSYALARVGDMAGDDVSQPAEYDSYGGGYTDAGRGGKGVTVNPVLPALVAALQQQGIDRIADADRVAALAYRSGNYTLAQTLVDQQSSALASWVRAKLALRKGDIAAAAQAYADASKAFPRNDASVEPASLGLIKAEQSVLTLSRGQYVEAFDQLYSVTKASQVRYADKGASLSHPFYSDYSGDTWYLAERVLTADELKNYVDAHAPATPVPAPPATLPSTPDKPYYEWLSAHPPQISDYLRRLLARRLVREGRVAEALPYFPDDQDLRYVQAEQNYTDGTTSLATWRYRASAKAYGEALEDAQHAWRAVNRAQAWYAAATLARRRGMDIMGYEQSPDYTAFDGMLNAGIGRSSVGNRFYGEPKKVLAITTPAQRAAVELPGPFVTEDERKRYAASESKPNQRYHYRYIAVDYIMKAADQLPPRSQAFAAVLCQGTSFVFYDAALAPTLYRRYVKQGAAVPFAADFGQNCVAPDFKAAARFPYVQVWKQARHWSATHRALALALLVLLLAGLGLLGRVAIKRRQLRRQAPQD